MTQQVPQQHQQVQRTQTAAGQQQAQGTGQAGADPEQYAEQQLQEAQQYQQQVGGQAQSAPQGAVFQTANFLPEEVRDTSAQTLNQVLADAIVVVSQVKSAHWNVRGPEFYQLHELFDDVAEAVGDHVDEIAERVTALGGTAQGTVQQAARQTTVPAMPAGAVSGEALLQHVAQTLSAFDAQLYRAMETIEEYEDLDTVDLLNEVSRDVSKSLWFVEAHLQGAGAQQGTGGQLQGQSIGTQQ